MPSLILVIVFGSVAIALFVWVSGIVRDAGLDAQMAALHERAKAELSSEDRSRLYALLLEIKEAGLQEAAAKGLSGKQISRAMKGSAIQTIAGFLEIERMFNRGNKTGS